MSGFVAWFRRSGMVAAFLLFSGSSFLAQETEVPAGGPTSRFIAFDTFRPRFHHDTETFTLVANFYIVNASAQTLKDLTFTQTFPSEFKLAPAPEDIKAQLVHPPEFWEKIEGDTYRMFEPKLIRRQGATILAELSLARRMAAFNIPATRIEFTLPDGQAGKEETIPSTIDVSDYANHVGDLNRFLRKKADIGLDVTVSGRDHWEFAPIDAVATGRNPQGIIGVETSDNGYTGNFRLHHGGPGDALDILVAWKQTHKEERLPDEAAALNAIGEYLKWTGPFKIDPAATKVTKGKFKKYDAWILEGRYIDTFPKRLGSGPLKAVAFYSGREDVEYYLLFQAQGRGMGPEKSETEAPEKEQALMAIQEKILDTFRSEIDPISTNR